MTGGQRKRTQTQQHTQHQHHKKRHASQHHLHPPPSRPHQQHTHPLPPPVATTTTNLYHDSPHNYLTGITATSSSSLLPQNHVFQSEHTKRFPSSSPLNLHESGQLFNMEEDVFGQEGDIVGGDAAVVSVDTVDGEPMTIPSYLTKNFASFPLPTTTYETEIIPHNSEGFNAVKEGLDGLLEDMEEDNEITGPVGRGKSSLESMILAEQQMKNYHHHQQHHKPSSSTKSIKNEQLLQQLLQMQQNEQPEIMNTAAYKSAKLRANKYKTEKDFLSEDDLTEAMMMYTPSAGGSRHNQAQSFNRPAEDATTNSGSIKALTVDDIWSQLQQQYLNKYSPQAQPLVSADSDEQQQPFTPTATTIKTKPKRKRNIKRQRHAKPTTATTSYSISWPAKSHSSSSTGNSHHSKHYAQPIKYLQQQQQYYDDLHSPPSASAFSGISLSAHADADFFAKRPFNKLNTRVTDEEEIGETDDETVAAEFGDAGDDDNDDDDFDVYGDESFEEAVYQRGKKFTGHPAYGQQKHGHTNNPFNSHDLYGSFSTPVTATVATNLQPSTYHPNLVPSTLPSFTYSSSSSTSEFLPTLSHPSTSYQWRSQQNYPASYQTYLLQHQQQQPSQWPAGGGEGGEEEQYYQQHQSSALRLPKATIIQTPNAIVSAKLSPTQSNDLTAPSPSSHSSSSSSSVKSTAQTPARYKKRKNRIKPKRNRIVVI